VQIQFEVYLRALLLLVAVTTILSLSLSLLGFFFLVTSNTRYTSAELEVKIRMGGDGWGYVNAKLGSSDLKAVFI